MISRPMEGSLLTRINFELDDLQIQRKAPHGRINKAIVHVFTPVCQQRPHMMIDTNGGATQTAKLPTWSCASVQLECYL